MRGVGCRPIGEPGHGVVKGGACPGVFEYTRVNVDTPGGLLVKYHVWVC